MLASVPSIESSLYVFFDPLVASVIGYQTSIEILRLRAGSVSCTVLTPAFHGPATFGSWSGSGSGSGIDASGVGSGGPSSPIGCELSLAEHAPTTSTSNNSIVKRDIAALPAVCRRRAYHETFLLVNR